MRKRTDKVVAEGEATGHYHALQGDAVVFGDGPERRIVANEEVTLTHQEHGSQKVAEGEYDTILVKEFDPFEEAVRNVVD